MGMGENGNYLHSHGNTFLWEYITYSRNGHLLMLCIINNSKSTISVTLNF